jgi:membrane protein implicated in regulation of membrane protease activity
MESMVGTRALVTATFAAGTGRVKIGDTEWLAHALNGENFAEGVTVIIKDVEATAVKVSAS